MANVIKVEVDLSDLYTDDDNDFTEIIKSDISRQVKSMVWESFKASAFEEFSKKLKEEFEGEKNSTVQDTIKKFIEEKKVEEYGSEYTIEKYVEKKCSDFFMNNDNLTRLLNDMVRKQADAIYVQIKERYDLLFASQIVSKLGENGFLKDNIADLLLKK